LVEPAAAASTGAAFRGRRARRGATLYDDPAQPLLTFAAARKLNSGRVFPEWPQRVLGLQTETLKARDRLNRLQTGMRAEHNLAAALAELASAFGAWHRGLTATDEDVVTAAIAAMRRHHRNAARLGKSGLADLKAGR
jgi:hypothetical protein